MGKHDKKEEQKVEFKWDTPGDDFYKARISELRVENARLREANAGFKTTEKIADVYAKNIQSLDSKNFDLETQLEKLQAKYDSALEYIEKLEQTKFDLERKIEEYESAILKVVVQI